MNLQEAKSLKVGDRVWCAQDKFSCTSAGPGRVTGAPGPHTKASKTLNGDLYIWIEVERSGRKSVWPSTKLSKG